VSQTAAPLLDASRRVVASALVVDDDAFMLEFLRDMLDELGVREVRTARGCQEAIRSLDGTMPEVVLCDLNMPGRDGFLFMEDLASRRFAGTVIVVSGMDARTMNSAALMGRFHRLKIGGTVSKPVTREALAAALSKS